MKVKKLFSTPNLDEDPVKWGGKKYKPINWKQKVYRSKAHEKEMLF